LTYLTLKSGNEFTIWILPWMLARSGFLLTRLTTLSGAAVECLSGHKGELNVSLDNLPASAAQIPRYRAWVESQRSDHLGIGDRAVVDNVPRIERSRRFKQNNLALRPGNRFVLHATWNNA